MTKELPAFLKGVCEYDREEIMKEYLFLKGVFEKIMRTGGRL